MDDMITNVIAAAAALIIALYLGSFAAAMFL
ncbi:hypothetical protein FHW37_104600 [Neorhizobium alkalisoli]|uniref:Uncharacterized protein n=1 Tax=Neorhizobium alkalisoli TaxID=528178 RepID=A0A561QSF3_9HYPH|nr:hypothetical protein FHW37_104600 [Neorhizobium alkalisoli]